MAEQAALAEKAALTQACSSSGVYPPADRLTRANPVMEKGGWGLMKAAAVAAVRGLNPARWFLKRCLPRRLMMAGKVRLNCRLSEPSCGSTPRRIFAMTSSVNLIAAVSMATSAVMPGQAILKYGAFYRA